jgi:hypothetical protein
METVDEESFGAALDFVERHAKAKEPFFCYLNTTRMHVRTRLKPSSQGVTGLGSIGRNGGAGRLRRPSGG